MRHFRIEWVTLVCFHAYFSPQETHGPHPGQNVSAVVTLIPSRAFFFNADHIFQNSALKIYSFKRSQRQMNQYLIAEIIKTPVYIQT